MAAGEFDQLTSDVAALGAAEQGAEGRVAAMADLVSTLQAEIVGLKATNPSIAAQIAGIESITSRLASLAAPAAAPSDQAPPDQPPTLPPSAP